VRIFEWFSPGIFWVALLVALWSGILSVFPRGFFRLDENLVGEKLSIIFPLSIFLRNFNFQIRSCRKMDEVSVCSPLLFEKI